MEQVTHFDVLLHAFVNATMYYGGVNALMRGNVTEAWERYAQTHKELCDYVRAIEQERDALLLEIQAARASQATE